MSAEPQPHLSFDDWLAIERTSTDQRCEYVAGEVFAMAGGSEEHNLIAATEVGAYPDVMVICGERDFHDGRRDVVTNPTLIVEVLSDSTEAYDRGDKFRYYRSLPSLQAYLLLSQDRIQAELFLRQSDGTWSLSTYQESSESIPLSVIEAELSLAEVYDKVEGISG
ncbi:hypothetical protein CKO42_06270 [Lamprobacter modestohalophilus]|uniref:Putative restriction endonuclease domain-containing protein n=1 Tax=Lamprobacter modestohalophilus TaxID=1064514 RepID=A0A9X0W6S8_9GAMM|nr:Uma2 family endonuclease [Lamprobacter modestohalophilus]MBK1618057.1 hypothetical protein [Lamprobacter modestohalophilus]